MGLVLITIAFVAAIMVMMAVGVLIGRKALKGSCGGAIPGPDGRPMCRDCGCGRTEDESREAA